MQTTSTIPTKSKAKKLKLWLEELPQSLYNKAMKYNADQNRDNRLEWMFEGGITALQLAFDFAKTEEGRDYWFDVMEDIY